jgi:hypothetical protein
VPNLIQNLQQKTDAFLTDYLRDTTTDQEILDFYGEGNIIGRKGIPESRSELFDQILEYQKASNANENKNRLNRPVDFDSYKESYGERVPVTAYENIDMPANSPTTGRPWQMTFGKLAFPYEARLTPTANQFLDDFRVPKGVVDYGFDTGPNILDRNERDIAAIKEDPRSYLNVSEGVFDKRPEHYHKAYEARSRGEDRYMRQEDIDKITKLENRQPGFLRPSMLPATPNWWKEDQGYEIPANIKNATLDTFKEAILQREGPFGSVSQLTPVPMYGSELRPGGDPNWRANLYEKTGLAGPVYPQQLKGDRDVMKNDVQSFVAGRERLLPIQPYTEFFEGSAPSVVGKEPAPDFTPLQKALGTRNYLIGRNILEGRGNLGKGFAGGLSIGAADLIPSREIVADFYNKGPVQGLARFAGDILGGIPAALITGGAVTAAPVLAPIAAGTGLALTGNRALGAADEIIKRQTGEGILSKVRQAIGTAPRTGVAAKPTPVNQPLTAEIRPLSSKEKTNMINRENRNEIQRRIDLAGERFNPRRGDFGLSELLFGR